MDTMCYFNNAATSFPKPEYVKKSVMDFFTHPPINSSRHCNCIKKNTDTDIVCKNKIRSFFNIDDDKYDVIITPSATYSANIIIDSFKIENYNSLYVHLITNNWIHNSIIRTHYEKIGSKPIIVKDIKNIFDVKKSHDYYWEHEYYVALSHVNNVDGSKLSDKELDIVIKYCKDHKNLPLVLDITQSAGTFDIDVGKLDYDNLYIMCSCHKGLYSLQGIGFIVAPKNSITNHLISGGSGGVNSIDYKHTDTLEPGTQNELAMSSLISGIEYIEKTTTQSIQITKSILYNYFIEKYKDFKFKNIFDKIFELVEIKDEFKSSGIVCFKILDKQKSDILIQRLTDEYGIITRSGVHCTPLYHINVLHCDTTWRISFGFNNTKYEINYFYECLSKILI